MEVTVSTCLQQRQNDVVFTEISNLVIILQSETGEIHYLNEPASELWRLLTTPQSVNSLVQQGNHDTASALLAWLQEALDKKILEGTRTASPHPPVKDLLAHLSPPQFIESTSLFPKNIHGGTSMVRTDALMTGS